MNKVQPYPGVPPDAVTEQENDSRTSTVIWVQPLLADSVPSDAPPDDPPDELPPVPPDEPPDSGCDGVGPAAGAEGTACVAGSDAWWPGAGPDDAGPVDEPCDGAPPPGLAAPGVPAAELAPPCCGADVADGIDTVTGVITGSGDGGPAAACWPLRLVLPVEVLAQAVAPRAIMISAVPHAKVASLRPGSRRSVHAAMPT